MLVSSGSIVSVYWQLVVFIVRLYKPGPVRFVVVAWLKIKFLRVVVCFVFKHVQINNLFLRSFFFLEDLQRESFSNCWFTL